MAKYESRVFSRRKCLYDVSMADVPDMHAVADKLVNVRTG